MHSRRTVFAVGAMAVSGCPGVDEPADPVGTFDRSTEPATGSLDRTPNGAWNQALENERNAGSVEAASPRWEPAIDVVNGRLDGRLRSDRSVSAPVIADDAVYTRVDRRGPGADRVAIRDA